VSLSICLNLQSGSSSSSSSRSRSKSRGGRENWNAHVRPSSSSSSPPVVDCVSLSALFLLSFISILEVFVRRKRWYSKNDDNRPLGGNQMTAEELKRREGNVIGYAHLLLLLTADDRAEPFKNYRQPIKFKFNK